MNNQSLDDLIKRDKKLGRMTGKKQSAPAPKGKRPNRIQQQRNTVAAAKQRQQPAQQRNQQVGRIRGRGAGI